MPSGPSSRACSARPGSAIIRFIWIRRRSTLFAYLERRDDHGMATLPEHPVMRRWWEHMKDIMRANPDGSPVAVPLAEMFHLP